MRGGWHDLRRSHTETRTKRVSPQIHPLTSFTRHAPRRTHSIEPDGELVAPPPRLLLLRHDRLALATDRRGREAALVLYHLHVGAISLLRAGRVCQLRDVFSRTVGGLVVSYLSVPSQAVTWPSPSPSSCTSASLRATHALRLRPTAEVIRRDRVQRRMGRSRGSHVGGGF